MRVTKMPPFWIALTQMMCTTFSVHLGSQQCACTIEKMLFVSSQPEHVYVDTLSSTLRYRCHPKQFLAVSTASNTHEKNQVFSSSNELQQQVSVVIGDMPTSDVLVMQRVRVLPRR